MVTRHRRRPQARARDLAVRRVRALTVVTGLGSVAGAGALAVAVANADPSAWSAPAPAPASTAPATTVATPQSHPPPRSLTATKRARHHATRAASSVRRSTRSTVTRTAPHTIVRRAAPQPKPKPTHTYTPAPAPAPTHSATSSGGSHH